jgi:hypothetical protein
VLILQRPWTEQPQEPALPEGGEYANPLFALLPSGAGFINFGRSFATFPVSGTAAVSVGPGGRGVVGPAYAGTGGVPLTNNAEFRFSGSAGTLIFHLREPDLSGIGSPIIYSVRDGTTTHVSFFINDDNATVYQQLAFQIGTTTLTAASYTIVENQDDVVAVSWGANGMRIFSRSSGGLVASNATTTLPSTNTVQPFLLNRSTGARGNPGLIYSAFGYQRQLADAEIVSAISGSGAPYAELLASRRIYIPYAAAAGNWPNILSAPTYVPGSLTSTGFRPRVTATY